MFGTGREAMGAMGFAQALRPDPGIAITMCKEETEYVRSDIHHQRL